jgi:hypothetical protein
MVRADASNNTWQCDLSAGGRQCRGHTARAGRPSRRAQGLSVERCRLVALDPGNNQWNDDFGGIAFKLVLAQDFAAALDVADRAIARAPDEICHYTNRAHAVMFLGRTDEARTLYLKYRDQANAQDGKSRPTVIRKNFAEFRLAGPASPLMTGVGAQRPAVVAGADDVPD